MKTGNLNGRFWLNDTDEELGFKYTDVAKLEREEVESYFDMVAKDYARAMVNWGYCMPEILSNAVIANGGVVPSSNLKVSGILIFELRFHWILYVRDRIIYIKNYLLHQVIDLGCGDGAIGEALKKRGFRNINGVDISQSMINIAQSKGVYDVIKKADLMKALPFDNKSFDLLVTAAVTTYLGNWMKYIIISHILLI